MSGVLSRPAADDDHDPWERLADHQEALEMCIEEDTAYAEQARTLLAELERRGHR